MSADTYTPSWVLVCGGRSRCTECGSFVSEAWTWFATLTTSTHALCLECVDLALDGKIVLQP